MNDASELVEKLTYKQKHIAEIDPSVKEKATAYCEEYKSFLDASKTEREFTQNAISMLVKAGYVEFCDKTKYKAGDKVYVNNRDKSVIASTIGKKSLANGVRMVASHIDSPRLDLKPNPLYQDNDMALFKTHYYGGIKKYQWVTIPLSLHGVVCLKNGEKIEINIGEKHGDPVFYISDLLPHLSSEQYKKSLYEGIKAEELNIIVGSVPFEAEDVSNKVKLNVLSILNEMYNITEKDFLRAEIEAVPNYKASDVGFDRSLIGAYAHDDKVCAYASLVSEIELKNPEFTSVCALTDKEETGSDGNTGLNSDYLYHYLERLAQMQDVDYKEMFRNTKCLSADVNAGLDPTFPSVHEKYNAAKLNYGCVITKYTGVRGKGDTSDANAEMMAYVTDILDDANVVWQTGELGANDVGGGGTVAKYIANRNIDVIDIGIPLLSMHAPMEIASKLDIYMLYKAFEAFLKVNE